VRLTTHWRQLRVLLAMAVGFGQLSFASGPADAQDAFYQATAAEIAGPVGTLIRKEPRIGALQAPRPTRFSIDRPSRTDRPSRSLES
jgi:hypothetical protein